MKKVLIISFLLFTSLLAISQNFHAGLTGGVAGSLITGKVNTSFKKFGLIGGGFVSYFLSEKTCLQTEIYFIEKGCHVNPNPDKNQFETYHLSLQYMEVPLLFAFENSNNMFFEIGPSVGWLIKSSEKDEYGIISNALPFNKNDVGINLGARLPFQKGFSVNFRLFNSLLPVRKHASGAQHNLNQGQYNTVISLRCVYEFQYAKPKED